MLCITLVFLLSINSIAALENNKTIEKQSNEIKVTASSTTSKQVKTFTELAKEIKKSKKNSKLVISGKYKYNPKTDKKYKNGITITKNLKIVGLKNTIINGNGKSKCLNIAPHCKVSITRVKFINGYSTYNGGAVQACSNSKLVIKNCLFNNNKVYKANGGAIGTGENVKLKVENSKFYNNKAIRASHKKWPKDPKGMGGAIHMSIGSKFKLQNSVFKKNNGYMSIILILSQRDGIERTSAVYVNKCLFEKNTANVNGVFYLDEYGKGKFLNTKFKSNTAKNKGGTLILDASKKAIIQKCLFQNNHGIFGAAIDLFKYNKRISHVSIKDSTFINNNAKKSGGAIYSDYGHLKIQNSKFYKNKAKSSGGAIEVTKGKLRLIKPVFKSNSAKNGGALLIKNKKQFYMVKAKFSKNKASVSGNNILGIVADCVYKLKILH